MLIISSYLTFPLLLSEGNKNGLWVDKLPSFSRLALTFSFGERRRRLGIT